MIVKLLQLLLRNSNVFTAGAFGGGIREKLRLQLHGHGADPKVQTSAVLGMQTSDEWSLWKRNMPVKYIVQTNNKGRLTAQSYDADQCNCEPPEVSKDIKQPCTSVDSQTRISSIVVQCNPVHTTSKNKTWT